MATLRARRPVSPREIARVALELNKKLQRGDHALRLIPGELRQFHRVCRGAHREVVRAEAAVERQHGSARPASSFCIAVKGAAPTASSTAAPVRTRRASRSARGRPPVRAPRRRDAAPAAQRLDARRRSAVEETVLLELALQQPGDQLRVFGPQRTRRSCVPDPPRLICRRCAGSARRRPPALRRAARAARRRRAQPLRRWRLGRAQRAARRQRQRLLRRQRRRWRRRRRLGRGGRRAIRFLQQQH